MTAPVAPPTSGPLPVTVAGGAGGIAARFDDLTRLGERLASAGLTLGTVAAEADLVAVVVLDPTTTLLDPVGAGAAVAGIARAVHGGVGVATLAAGALGLAAAVRGAAAAYAAAEAVTGTSIGEVLRSVAALPGALGAGLATGSLATGVQTTLAHDPWLVDSTVLAVGNGAPARSAALLGGWFPDGRAVLTPHPAGATVTAAPRDVAGLVQALSVRNDDVPGAVDVRVLTTVDPDGTVHRRAVVDVPGTKDWSLTRANPDVTGLGSNLRALSGADTTYADGVLAALTAAGVDPGTEVLFVGHSLGGMVAVAAAGRAQASGYRVGGVVTVGSPLGAVPPPRGVPVLAIENAGDVVPHLDGAGNPDTPDLTTVTVDHPYASVGGNHGLGTAYLAGAADVDASTDPSVVAARERLTPFLTADTAETHVFVVTRQVP